MISRRQHVLAGRWWDRIWVAPRGRACADGEAAAGARRGRVGGKLEGIADGGVVGVDVDALACADGVEVVEVEEGVVALEEGLALSELALEPLCVAAGGEGLAMAVFLLAGGACGGTGGAARVLGVALGEEEDSRRGLADARADGAFAVGRHRRDLP